MTKKEFLAMFAAMYRVANLSDSDNENKANWTKPEMAGAACCQLLDQMASRLVEAGVLTAQEVPELYDTL